MFHYQSEAEPDTMGYISGQYNLIAYDRIQRVINGSILSVALPTMLLASQRAEN